MATQTNSSVDHRSGVTLVFLDGDSVSEPVWRGMRHLVDRIASQPSPGLIIAVDSQLAGHACTLLAAALGLIKAAGSTDGRFYILQAADQGAA